MTDVLFRGDLGPMLPRPRRLSLLSALLALLAVALGPLVTPASAAVVGLDVTTVLIQPIEGVQFNGTVANFPDPGVGPYQALIDWGDGQTSAGSASGSCQGTTCNALINGVHMYRKVGTYLLKVHAFNFNGLADGQDAKPITVKDAPLTSPVGRTIGMTPGTPLTNVPVATFADLNVLATPDDYSITIDWGDGTTSPGTAVPFSQCCGNSGAHFTIKGTHTYSSDGNYTLTATAVDILGQEQKPKTVSAQSQVYGPHVQMLSTSATEGRSQGFSVARIPADHAGVSYTVTINWGDGVVDGPQGPGGGCFADGCFWFAGGVHTYAEEGDYPVVVTFTGSDGSGATDGKSLTVSDAPLTRAQAKVIAFDVGGIFNGEVANFFDPNSGATAGDFTATIDWGDGTSSSGSVAATPSCCSGELFKVSGSHGYATPGPFQVQTTITDKGQATATVVGPAGGLKLAMAPINLASGASQPNFLVTTFRAEAPCNDFNAPGYGATIDWGDGTTSHGGMTNSGGCAGTYFLGDHHTYARGGYYSVSVTIKGSDGSGGSGFTTATVTPVTSPPANASPVLGSLLPNSAKQGGGAFTLTVTGTDFANGAVVRWNGVDRPTSVLSPSLLAAVIPATDLATSSDLVVPTVTVFNPTPGGGTSNPLPLTISSARVSRAHSAIAAAGATVSASTAPSAAGEAGVSVSMSNTASGPVTATAATYAGNPTPATVFDSGGGFVDVRLSGAAVSGAADGRFYYPSTVTGAPEASLQLLYFDGAAWTAVRGSGNAAPVKDDTDNLDGTVSGGRFSVTFDTTSTPTLNGLSGTVFTVSTLPEPGGGTSGGSSGGPPSATPEIDSLVLFGGGLSSVGGFALLRLRARRRH